MRLSEIYAQRPFCFSFEVYPPKTEAAAVAMRQHVDLLVRYQPGFISCTYGAGGTTQDQTLDICADILGRHKVPVMAHLTCVGSPKPMLLDWLVQARLRGITNIMALRGDPPKGQESFQAVEGGLSYANELVALIKKHEPGFGIGVGGYPEVHQEAPNAEVDLTNLKRKVDAGADAIISQLFYDNADFYRFQDKCLALGINIYNIPGILPITNFAQIKRISGLCKAAIPTALAESLEKHQADPEATAKIGIEHAIRQCEDLRKSGVPSIHFYVLNQSDATIRVLEQIGMSAES